MASLSDLKKVFSAAIAALLGGGSGGGRGGYGGSAGGPEVYGGGYSGRDGGILGGSAGLPPSGPEDVKNDLGKSSGGFTPFLVPVSTGASLTHNLVGKETPREGAHEQTVAEHTAHMKELVDKYYREHPIPAGLKGTALRQAASIQALRAMDYAIKEEPNTYLGYISQDMDGVKADQRPRTVNGRTFNASSSWVGAVKRTSPNEVQVYLGASKNNPSGWYTYGGSAKQVEDFLTGDSLGREIGAIRKGGGTTLKKLW